MNIKYLIIVLLIISILGCKKDPTTDPTEIAPASLRLSKVEFFGWYQPVINYPTTGDPKLISYQEFSYDSRGRLTDQWNYFLTSSTASTFSQDRWYKFDYGTDGKISKITFTTASFPPVIITYVWSDKTISANFIHPDGTEEKYKLDLNESGIPIRKTVGSSISEVQYDSKGNAVKMFDGSISGGISLEPWAENIEHDTTKFNPYTSSYELRIFSNIFLTESLVGRSRNWVLKTKLSPPSPIYNNQEIILELNKEGYPTKTRSTSSSSTSFTQYTYTSK